MSLRPHTRRTSSRRPRPRGLGVLPFALVALLGAGCHPPDGVPCADPDDCRLFEAGALAGVRIGFHDEDGSGGANGELAAVEGNALTNHGVS